MSDDEVWRVRDDAMLIDGEVVVSGPILPIIPLAEGEKPGVYMMTQVDNPTTLSLNAALELVAADHEAGRYEFHWGADVDPAAFTPSRKIDMSGVTSYYGSIGTGGEKLEPGPLEITDPEAELGIVADNATVTATVDENGRMVHYCLTPADPNQGMTIYELPNVWRGGRT